MHKKKKYKENFIRFVLIFIQKEFENGYLSPAAQQNLQLIYDHRYMENNFEIRVSTNLHAIERPINRAARCSAVGDRNS
jgi:hypothetical protein